MKRKYLKDKLMMIAAELDNLIDELGRLSAELEDEDPMQAVSVKELPPEDR